jgi:hypothetical protein
MSTGTRGTPSWLTDEAIERAYALGREMEEFLLRRERRKRLNPHAKVNIGPRLRKLLANLDRDEHH